MPHTIPNIDLSCIDFPKLQSIQKEKARLEARRDRLNEKIEALSQKATEMLLSAGALPKTVNGKPRQRSQRGSIKGPITEALEAGGSEGVSVKQLVEQTGISRRRIERWLYSDSALRHTPGLKKLGPARFTIKAPPVRRRRK